MHILLATLFLAVYGVCWADDLEQIPKELNDKARSFMASHGLIHEEDEADRPRFQMSTKWSLTEIRTYKSDRLLIMRIVSQIKGRVSEISDELEVIVERSMNGKKELLLFEEAYELPSKIIARVGKNPDDTRYYYVELSGFSAIQALKSVYTGVRYHGFSGIVVADGKAKFDPTPNRTWRVVDAQYDLRRGKSAEVMDIQSYQLDKDFEGFTRGAKTKESPEGVTGAHVAPWGQSAVLEIVPENSSKRSGKFKAQGRSKKECTNYLE